MPYSLIEKKRIRKDFGKLQSPLPIPDLLEMQSNSYEAFAQSKKSLEDRTSTGLQGVFHSLFPLASQTGNAELHYISYEMGKPLFDADECIAQGIDYAAPLHATVQLKIFELRPGKGNKRPKALKEIREEKIYLGELPLMIDQKSFIIKGIERVIVSQLHRSPGVFAVDNASRTMAASSKRIYSVQVIPNRGSWLGFEFDTKDLLSVRIDKKSKMPATLILKAFGYSDEEILEKFFDTHHVQILKSGFNLTLIPEKLRGQSLRVDITDSAGKVVVKADTRITNRQIDKLIEANVKKVKIPVEKFPHEWVLAQDVVDASTGEIVLSCNVALDEARLTTILEAPVKSFKVLIINDLDRGGYIADTLRADPANNKDEALSIIYSTLRSEQAQGGMQEKLQRMKEEFFRNLFFSATRYDLSEVGRMKLNLRVGRTDSEGQPLFTGQLVLTEEDIVDVLKVLIAVRDGREKIDEIDHLGNRRIRSVGEMLENQFRIGLVRMTRAVKERLGLAESENFTPKNLINAKPVSAAIKEFFGSSQLSQFADQINPLSGITHKRRVSALGPGGLNRDRAGFEVRDVNSTHYGRICPIETPEGPNIGLINSLALFARPDEYGFLQTPYRKVINNKVTHEIGYSSAIDEKDHVIAQANVPLNSDGSFKQSIVDVRYQNEFTKKPAKDVEYMDVTPQQVVSPAAALIPFLEHNDANRALMGSNMQRQAVPTLRAEKPLVGTGMERYVARDSGACQLAQRDGIVDSVDAARIVVRVGSDSEEVDVDIYNLKKYIRSNQSTCIDQRPLVVRGDIVKADDVLADGPSTDMGELSLGQNVRVAFMPWSGYNFEDAIVVSERLVHEDRFTSIHIQEHVCTARETKLGVEEITQDISNVSEQALSKLDECGIVYIGAEVEPGDILVGKVTPKGETQLTPEERLLRAIFGEKASDVKDTSLRVPASARGTVIDVRVLTRENIEKDARSKSIDRDAWEQVNKDCQSEYDILEKALADHLRQTLMDKTVAKGTDSGVMRLDSEINAEQLAILSNAELFGLSMQDGDLNETLERSKQKLKDLQNKHEKKLEEKREKLNQGASLPPDICKIVKVFLAVKRPVQPGDKMAGRHGNKGVISAIMPVEDMPFDEDGVPVDIVLNPLGVPSRMNIGQILETHLGWAAKTLGRQIEAKLKAYKAQQASMEELRELLHSVYENDAIKSSSEFSNQEICELAGNLSQGVPMATRVFDGASEEEIRQMLELAGLPTSGQTVLYDGRTGEPFARPITVGYMYMLKLDHLVDDKMHARSTGSYSLVTQQPLGGKSNNGGQRFGEMEVWALEAYGAAYTLQEMLTVKSDDVTGRSKMYMSMVNNKNEMEARAPEVFNVLMKEIQAMAINLEKRPA